MNRKINVDEMMLEVTQRCNMSCAHCLRGEANNVDMTEEIVNKALQDVESIGSLCFSGGEPSLNIPIIEYTLQYCKEHDIMVDSFFVATNGKKVTLEFLMAMIKWYAYVDECGGEVDMCELALSSDIFHEDIDPRNKSLLGALGFFSSESKNTDFDSVYLINEGRAKDLGPGWKKRTPHYYGLSGEVFEHRISVESMLYISAKGDVKTDCDTAFDNDACTIGNILEDDLSVIVANELEDDEVDDEVEDTSKIA